MITESETVQGVYKSIVGSEALGVAVSGANYLSVMLNGVPREKTYQLVVKQVNELLLSSFQLLTTFDESSQFTEFEPFTAEDVRLPYQLQVVIRTAIDSLQDRMTRYLGTSEKLNTQPELRVRIGKLIAKNQKYLQSQYDFLHVFFPETNIASRKIEEQVYETLVEEAASGYQTGMDHAKAWLKKVQLQLMPSRVQSVVNALYSKILAKVGRTIAIEDNTTGENEKEVTLDTIKNFLRKVKHQLAGNGEDTTVAVDIEVPQKEWRSYYIYYFIGYWKGH